MSGDNHPEVAAFEQRIGHVFHDKALLSHALTHSSYGDGRAAVRDNERLEFLGDRVLGLLAARFLFQAHNHFAEGEMAPRLNALVRKEACARAARKAGLGRALRLSKNEDRHGGRDKTSILGDACEAILAALYLDGGMEAAEAFFNRFWDEALQAAADDARDPKSLLQEWAQGEDGALPRYQLLQRTGPDHAPVFEVEAQTAGYSARGRAGSKRDAERAAAIAILRMCGQIDD